MKKLLLFAAFILYNFTLGQSIVSVTPNNANRGQALEIQITGENVNFDATSPTLHVAFIDQFSNILNARDMVETYWDGIRLDCYLEVPGHAIPGLYDVRVYNDQGTIDITKTDSFTVNDRYTYSLRGNVRIDSNGNGCDASDPPVPNQRINFTNGANSGTLIADTSGFYNYYNINSGNNSFTPVIENPYYTISPPSATVNITSGNPTFIQDFCITPNGTHNDLEIMLYPVTNARPGFDAYYQITYKNKGTHVQNGTVVLNFDDTIMDLITVNPASDSQGANSLTWNFSNLAPFESRNIVLTMNINSPVEIPAVEAGDVLVFSAVVNGATDETPVNNTSNLNQTVVGSIDPNDKTCIEGNTMPIGDVGKYLHYVIRFENTGTANAEFVVIRDIIDTSKFDISTLTPLSGSHSFTTKIRNTNEVEFLFENINLPFDDANNDGYVTFKIKTKPNLTIGTHIENTADIFFDYNAAVVTNTYRTTVSQPMNTGDFEFNNVFTLSPVPAKNNLKITVNQQVEISSVNIYNALGQLVQIKTNPSETIDVSGLKSGTYFIKIISDKGTASSQFLKE